MSSELPQALRSRNYIPHGASYWTRTAEITMKKADGSPLSLTLNVGVFPGGGE